MRNRHYFDKKRIDWILTTLHETSNLNGVRNFKRKWS